MSKAVQREAAGRGLQVFDATCPLVTKVHVEVAKMRAAGYEIVMIGHKGHPEVEGTMGQLDRRHAPVETVEDVERCRCVTPTRSRLRDADDALARRCGGGDSGAQAALSGDRRAEARDICYATQNRQDAVKLMAPQVDVVIVVGSPNSSNSNRLREVAERVGVPAYLVDSASQLDPAWFLGRPRIGVTAGASAPEVLVDELLAALKRLGAASVRKLQGVHEDVVFPMPKGLGHVTV